MCPGVIYADIGVRGIILCDPTAARLAEKLAHFKCASFDELAVTRRKNLLNINGRIEGRL